MLSPYSHLADVRSAGSRDSALTNHGYQQAMRLGKHLSSLGISVAHIFSSHLQRTVKTAGLIREAQVVSARADDTRIIPDVERLSVLTEQDFGSLEGKKWTDRSIEMKNEPGFTDVESKDSMARRADSFLDNHLIKLLHEGLKHTDGDIVIVSHGIFLSTLWKRLLLRLPPKSISLSSELQATARPTFDHLGGWSNTGYLELHMTYTAPEDSRLIAGTSTTQALEPTPAQPNRPIGDDSLGEVQLPQTATNDAVSKPEPDNDLANEAVATTTEGTEISELHQTKKMDITIPRLLDGWTTVIMTINGKYHLTGLKRTGGGVGSSRHDSSQKNIESFFKRRKLK